MSGMNKSGQGVDFDYVVDDDEVDVDAQRMVRVGWCRWCCWWRRGCWCSEGGEGGVVSGLLTSGSFGAEYKRRTWVGPGIRDALAGYSTTSGSGSEAEVVLCAVKIVQFYKVARARMLNLGIHRLAYLLFLMVVLNLFWITNSLAKYSADIL